MVTTMTNREKFTEIFGCEIVHRDTGEAIPGHCKILIASDKHFNEWLKQEYAPSATDTNVGGNLIDRQAALDALDEIRHVLDKKEKELTILPSAQPRQHGRWVNVQYSNSMSCSCCGHLAGEYKYWTYKFCPWCGAQMDGNHYDG